VFKKEIRSKKVLIDATQERIWEILFDIARYPEWNPFTHRVESNLQLGDNIDLYVHMPVRGDRMQRERVCVMKEPEQMAWEMELLSPMLLKARRDQFIRKAGEGTGCYYETVDAFEGLLSPLVTYFFGKDIKAGFDKMCDSLKERAEK
jgi:hypothetical protein